MLLSSTMQITCEVGNRVYHEKTDTYEFYGSDIISCTKETEGKVHCLREQRLLPSDEYFLLKEDDTWFYKLKHLYEEQKKAAKKSE